MRIRSIKPEFWESEDIHCLAIEDRLLFIGLWSYVDDNGVGKDVLARITADLFAGDLEQDSRETFARVSRGLLKLAEAGRIVRYIVDDKAYLWITNWEKHQRIDKPGKTRYPPPTRDDAVIRDTLATPSRESRDTLAPGAGEQGNRGTGSRGAVDARATAGQPPSPTPDAPPPTDGPTLTEQTLGEFNTWCDQNHQPRPPAHVRRQLAGHIAAMLTEQIPIQDVRRGLVLWQTKGGYSAGALPGFVHEARTTGTTKTRRQQETDRTFDHALAWAAEQDQAAEQKAIR